MKTTSFVAAALLSLSATVFSAPTPQLSNIIGSVTNPTAGSDNHFGHNGNGNGNHNGNDNEAGNNNGNGNEAGTGNEAGNGNTFNLPGLPGLPNMKDILKREAGPLDPVKDMLSSVTNTIGSVTNPGAGNNNEFEDNGNKNGNGNGNGNSAGNGNGNNNSAGSNNSAGNDNEFNVSPVMPDVELPDLNFSPTINLVRRSNTLKV